MRCWQDGEFERENIFILVSKYMLYNTADLTSNKVDTFGAAAC